MVFTWVTLIVHLIAIGDRKEAAYHKIGFLRLPIAFFGVKETQGMKISMTVDQLQRLVDQAFEDLEYYEENPQVEPRCAYYSGPLEDEMRTTEGLIKYYQGGFIFGFHSPKIANVLLSQYLCLWTRDYVGFWEDPLYYPGSIYQEQIFLADFMSEIKRLGFELALPLDDAFVSFVQS